MNNNTVTQSNTQNVKKTSPLLLLVMSLLAPPTLPIRTEKERNK
jgi:hypothetical protein